MGYLKANLSFMSLVFHSASILPSLYIMPGLEISHLPNTQTIQQPYDLKATQSNRHFRWRISSIHLNQTKYLIQVSICLLAPEI